MSTTIGNVIDQGMPVGERRALIPASIRWMIDHGDSTCAPARLSRLLESNDMPRQLTVKFATADDTSDFTFGCLVRNAEDAHDPLWKRLTAFERAAIVRAQSLVEEGRLPPDPKDDLLALALKTIEWVHQRAGTSPNDMVLAIGDSGQPEWCDASDAAEIPVIPQISHPAFPNSTPCVPESYRMFQREGGQPMALEEIILAGNVGADDDVPKPWPRLRFKTALGNISGCYVRHIGDATDPLFVTLPATDRALIIAAVVHEGAAA